MMPQSLNLTPWLAIRQDEKNPPPPPPPPPPQNPDNLTCSYAHVCSQLSAVAPNNAKPLPEPFPGYLGLRKGA